MNRDEMHEILNAYLDGTLPSEQRLELERTLEESSDLRSELESLREIVTAAGELPRSIPPSRDLWPEIEAQLRSERVVKGNFRDFRRTVFAAAAMVAIFVAGLMTGVWKNAPPPEDQVVQSSVPSEPTPVPSLYEKAELEYSAASQDLFATLGQRADRLDPATVELIRRNLDIIDEAVREIRGALDQEPSNPQLNQLLNENYRRRSELLRRAADLPGAI